MPDLIVSVNHRLSQDEALRRIQDALAHAKNQYSDKVSSLREDWNGYVGAFHVSAQNQQGSGTVAVNPSDVTVNIALPMVAWFFKSKIESGMRAELARILA